MSNIEYVAQVESGMGGVWLTINSGPTYVAAAQIILRYKRRCSRAGQSYRGWQFRIVQEKRQADVA